MRQLAIAVLAVLPAFAQQTQQQAPQQTFFTESIEVRVINVDVVVTKDGHPAAGLTKDDFELLENGKPQPITNFLEIRGEAAPPAGHAAAPAAPAETPKPSQDLRGRNIVVFIDSTSVQGFTRDRILPTLQQFIERAMDKGDRVMVVSWNPGLKVDLPFTTHRTEASTVLQRMVGTLTAGTRSRSDFAEAQRDILQAASGMTQTQPGPVGQVTLIRPPISDGIARARFYTDRVIFAQSQRIEALKSVLASLRGLSGRNALVLLTDQLTTNPALPIFQFLEGQKDKFDGASGFSAIVEAKQFEDPRIVSELADLANSTGVVLYPISASGLGVDNENISAERSAGEYSAVTRSIVTADEGLVTLRQIAAATGGTALTGSNNFQLAFDTVAQDMANYYSLGYHTEGQRQDAVRTISVKLKKKGYNVRTRETFVEKSLGSEMQDAVASNLLYPITKNDLNVTMVSAGPAANTENERRIVPVYVKIPTSNLTLIPDGTDLVGQFSSFTAFMRRDGRVSEVKKLQHQLRFPADSLKRRKEITVKLDLTVDDKTEDVSVGVMDDASHVTGFARLGVS